MLKRYKQYLYVKLQCTRCVALKSKKTATASMQKTTQQQYTRAVGKRGQLHHVRCSKCKAQCEDACWTPQDLRDNLERHTNLVCKECRAQGFHPGSLEVFTCQTCKGNFGSQRFDKDLLNHCKDRPCARLQCTQCAAQESERIEPATSRFTPEAAATAVDEENMFRTDGIQAMNRFEKAFQIYERLQMHQESDPRKHTELPCINSENDRLRCSKCKTAYEDACWTRVQRQNHRAQHTSLVCKACRAQGFHPRNLEAYACQTCRSNFGSKRFNKVMLHNYKQRPGAKLECMQCFAHKTKKEIRRPPQDPAAPTRLTDVPPVLLA